MKSSLFAWGFLDILKKELKTQVINKYFHVIRLWKSLSVEILETHLNAQRDIWAKLGKTLQKSLHNVSHISK